MKQSLRSKVQKAIEKIESGTFDEFTIDSLFSGLRQYSEKSTLFRELADFIAHPDERNEGIVNESLEAFYLSIRFFTEYASTKTKLNLSTPFPAYIVKLMKYQIDKCDTNDLKNKFNVTRDKLKARIDTIFSVDKKTKLASTKKEKVLNNNFPAIQFILSFIGSHPAFEQKEILSEIVKVVKSNGLKVNEGLFLAQSEKIILLLLLIMHEAEFKHGGRVPGYCRISCERTSISHNQRFIDSDGNPVDIEESFGHLQLVGHVVVPKDGNDLKVCYPILVTQLKVEAACDESLFVIEAFSSEHPNMLCKKAKFEQDLILTDSGTLGTKMPNKNSQQDAAKDAAPLL